MRLLRRLLQAAFILTLAVAFAACSSSDSTEVIVSSESPDPVQTPTPQAGKPEGIHPTPEPAADPAVPPTEAPDATGLVWTEVDLADALGADETSSIQLQSVGDGRILALRFIDRGMDSILVTENGREWTPMSIPSGFLPWSVDITGDRWLIQGWDSTLEDPGTQILFSDDEGETWIELPVDLSSFGETAWVVDAIVAGERIVVAVQSDTWQPEIDLAPDDERAYEPSEVRVHLYFSEGGPAELVAEFPGWASGGHGAADGFHLNVSDAGENNLLHSPDGREWTSTPADVEVTDSARKEIWTSDEGYTGYRTERFEGVYGSGQVLTLPEGIGRVPGLAVGPAGVAMVGGPASPFDESAGDFTMPDIVIEKDGYELRYNQPEGGITLWDVENDAAVYVYDAETLQQEGEFVGVTEVEGALGLDVVFHDPETGAELVTFSDEELAAAITEDESGSYSNYNPNKFLVGWSEDGTDWEWQTLQEAFGLPELSEDANSFTEVQVAVGRDFVLAQVQTFEFPEVEFDEDIDVGIGEGQPGSNSAPLTAPTSSPHRWFIARVG